ncbi:uncharacterized protein Dana_GF23686, isoform B [Drosophila ananassae]|uniref:Uncharacterized protein, isoform B n=1 Tax=Drosophila ananassae TaxID=7217 RepID=A0A0P8XVS3_DROAN|nr:centrosomal protein of 135 kDa isoform X1 [Drosophila ananassae]KPU78834.1 uncharacterized protein Dana_GF23686, isoform B [Drosophila ananassae]
MNINDGDFKDLRSKLDIMGFTQTLPVLAIPLVQAIFGDLIKTTECLRDTKKKVADLLEERTCWELGVEPYKCDNSRLLAECNELHLQFLREREDYELRQCESDRKIRDLQTDKEHLQTHNAGLQNQLDALLSKQLISASNAKRLRGGASAPAKKPFISTVRAGNAPPIVFGPSALKCTKCNAGVFQKTTTTTKDGVTVTQTSGQEELDKLQNELTTAGEQLEFYKRKVEARNREIRRLNDMLMGGRPPAALAKDCCYKEVGNLSQDIDLLQREKNELMAQLLEFQDKMHDAMQRAVETQEDNKKLQMQLDELKEAALQVEELANSEIDAKELEIKQMQSEIKLLQKSKEYRLQGGFCGTQSDNRNMNERLNVLTRREEELESTNEKHKKKLAQMQAKIVELQKELKDQNQHGTLDEEKIRLTSERDFFQKEYLRLMGKCGSETEIAFLHAQIKSKDEELKALRTELFPVGKSPFSPQKSVQYETLPPGTASSGSTSASNHSDCVQATIGRLERERDCVRSELERVRCERDTLREKQLSNVQLHAEELQTMRLRNEELDDRLRQLEREKRELNSARVPVETNLVLLKEDLVQMRKRIAPLEAEIERLKTENGQISLLNEQNERIITDYQAKLMVAERQRHSADVRASSLDTSRESNRNEVTQLRTEIGALRQTYISLEHEKDTLLNQLDNKTERVYKLEYELKDCKEKRNSLEQNVKDLEDQVRKLANRNRQRDSELTETSTESKTLRQQIVALKASRDEAIAENGRLMDKMSDAQAEVKTLMKKLKDSEQQVANMRQQLQKYVQEVKKAEDLLTQKVSSKFKERERDELLDHYHCLSQDQVALEGNNQSLECEAAEFKRQICDLESEIHCLKNQLHTKQCVLEEMDQQLTTARATIRCLERDLEKAQGDALVLKVDLEARKELCDKLDAEKVKLNAELNEVNDMRKKLEKQCERLKDELQQASAMKQVTTDTADQMLERLHNDQQRQDDADIRAKNHMERLERQYQQALKDLQEERERCSHQERLATEYEQQVRELRSNLNEDRFTRARSREHSPRVPSKTL